MARIHSERRKRLRNINQRARETADPVEKLRFVRSQMDAIKPLEEFHGRSLTWIAAVLAAALAAALLLWRLH
jgi:hypothetical protein